MKYEWRARTHTRARELTHRCYAGKIIRSQRFNEIANGAFSLTHTDRLLTSAYELHDKVYDLFDFCLYTNGFLRNLLNNAVKMAHDVFIWFGCVRACSQIQ